MVVIFEKTYLRELYESGRTSDKKHRYQQDIIKRYQKRVETLIAVPTPETLYKFNSLNFEALDGDRIGRYSVRVNNKYRIVFTLDEVRDQPMITLCNIVELSNHYD